MTLPILILGEALMDCVMQPDGTLMPLQGGSPYNLTRAAARQGARVGYLCPFSQDLFGEQLKATLLADGAQALMPDSPHPTSLAVVTLREGQPSYGFYREGIADRDYTPEAVLEALAKWPPGVLHSGSLMLMPPDHYKAMAVLRGARELGWTISVDVNLRPRMARDLDEYRAAVWAAVALADWVKASEEDLEVLGMQGLTMADAPQAIQRFRDRGATRVAITFGGAGACLWVEGQQACAPAPRVALVDTVGAGDTFWGACLADWATAQQGAPDRVAQTLTLAMAAAAMNCERKGCQPPTLAETKANLSRLV
jgi:fructokinase